MVTEYYGKCPRLDQPHIIHKGVVYLPRFDIGNHFAILVLFIVMLIYIVFWVCATVNLFSIGFQTMASQYILFTLIIWIITVYCLYEFGISKLSNYYATKCTYPRLGRIFYHKKDISELKNFLKQRLTPCLEENTFCQAVFDRKN